MSKYVIFLGDYAKFGCFLIENIMRSKKFFMRNFREHFDALQAALPEFLLIFLGMEKISGANGSKRKVRSAKSANPFFIWRILECMADGYESTTAVVDWEWT